MAVNGHNSNKLLMAPSPVEGPQLAATGILWSGLITDFVRTKWEDSIEQTRLIWIMAGKTASVKHDQILSCCACKYLWKELLNQLWS